MHESKSRSSGRAGRTEEDALQSRATYRLRLLALGIVFPGLVLLIAADAPLNLVRQGNAALTQGNAALAQQFYAAAEELAPDPGLVAFNEGVAHANLNEYRKAEQCFLRALDDREAPASRRARALYNRAVCILHYESTAAAYRIAIESLDACLRWDGVEGDLKADARHNLELAKLLWVEARKQERTPPKASDPAPERVPEAAPPERSSEPDPNEPPESEPGRENGPSNSRTPQPIGPDANRGQNPLETTRPAPGAGKLPVRLDAEMPQPLSAEDAHRNLEAIAERLQNDRRRNLHLLLKPEPRDVRNW